MDLRTGLIHGSELFFDLLGIRIQDRMITQEQWMASVHPEDLEPLVQEFQQPSPAAGAIT